MFAQVEEEEAVEDHLFVLRFRIIAHSISEEVAGLSSLWFPQ